MRLDPVPADQPIPMEDFLRPQFMADPKLNDAGTHVAFLLNSGDTKWSLAVIDIETGEASGFNGFNDGSVIAADWLTDDRLLFTLTFMNNVVGGLFVAERDNLGGAYPIIQMASYRALSLSRLRPMEPLAFARSWGTPQEGGIVRLDAALNAGPWVMMIREFRVMVDSENISAIERLNQRHVLETIPRPTTGGVVLNHLVDHNGEVAFASILEGGREQLRQWNGATWTTSGLDLERYSVLSVEDNPHAVVVREVGQRDKPGGILVVDGMTGEQKQELFRDDNYDLGSGLYANPATGRMVGLSGYRSSLLNVWFDESYRRVQALLDDTFKGTAVKLLDNSVDGRVFLFQTTSDRQPAVFYTLNLETKAVSLLKSSRPWIDPARMARTHSFQYRSPGGGKLDAYLTLPAGASKTSQVPMLVLVGDDRAERFTPMFDGPTQFWASRGYAVLAVNHRASLGLRWRYGPAVEWDYAGMANDVVAATRTAIKTGYIDAKHLAVNGDGTGGTLALMAAQRAEGLFKVAMVHGGVYDWNRTIKDRRGRKETDALVARFHRHFGAKADDEAYWDALSPMNALRGMTTAVFVSHSEVGQVVELAQAKAFERALRKAEIDHEAMYFDGAKFYTDPTSRQKLYRAMDAFLSAHL